MAKLLLKLRTALRKLPAFVAGTFARVLATEIVKTYILTKEALAILLATLSVWLGQLSQFSSSLFGYRLIQTPIYLDITKAASALILLYFVGWFGYKTREYKDKKEKTAIYFIPEGDVKWRVDRNANDVSTQPYCEKHQCKLIKNFLGTTYRHQSVYDYYCPVCKQNKLEGITEEELKKHYRIAVHKAEAINLGFAEGFKA